MIMLNWGFAFVFMLSVPAFHGDVPKQIQREHFIPKTILIKKTKDFKISGDGSSPSWSRTEWVNLTAFDSLPVALHTKAKILYSPTGIYCLFSCLDNKLSSTMQRDLMELWKEDVIEIFLQPDTLRPAYFEYELSPLNFELPLLVFNVSGKLNSWIPFKFGTGRETSHQTMVQGGLKRSHATVSSWTGEVFIPFQLLQPVLPERPRSGSIWKGNLYRIDYDHGEMLWAWQKHTDNFHDYKHFGNFQFE